MISFNHKSKHGSSRSLVGLDWLNFFLIDPQVGFGSFLPIYLASNAWNEQEVGMVLAVGGICGILAQTPAGAIVDSVNFKRTLIAISVITLALCSLLVAFEPSFWPVVSVQALIGSTSTLMGPAICAISLGIVGRNLFDVRQGRNQMFNSAGKVLIVGLMGWSSYYFLNRSVFIFIALLAIPSIFSLLLINPKEIDNDLARGSEDGHKHHPKEAKISHLFHDRLLIIFLICVVLFNFANAAILPLLGQLLSKDEGSSSMMYMSIFVVATQIIMAIVAPWSGRMAGIWGRKPLLLVAFAVLLIRSILYTLTNNIISLIAIQLLDGVAMGIYGVLAVLVIADLTKGTGRFNLTLGAAGTAIGIGSALSQVMAGTIVRNFGFTTGFLSLAAVALVAFLMLYFFFKETLNRKNH